MPATHADSFPTEDPVLSDELLSYLHWINAAIALPGWPRRHPHYDAFQRYVIIAGLTYILFSFLFAESKYDFLVEFCSVFNPFKGDH